MELNCRNVNEGLAKGLNWLEHEGIVEKSRNGDVIVSPEPVTTIYHSPRERVLFSPLRDANPFFHFFESLWMIHGDDDVQFPSFFAKNIANYSDDGQTLWGAYGRRWRSWFGYDQIPLLIQELRERPETRRAVLTMWNAYFDPQYSLQADLAKALNGGKDVPCNTHIYFDARGGFVNMTVCCRSNDIYWGTYGANAVHFSMLQEYIAASLGIGVGVYRQFSNNFHIYTAVVPFEKFNELAMDAACNDLYEEHENANLVKPAPLVAPSDTIENWNMALDQFMKHTITRDFYGSSFFDGIALPMFRAWHERKNKISDGLQHAQAITAPDWRKACIDWIARRAK